MKNTLKKFGWKVANWNAEAEDYDEMYDGEREVWAGFWATTKDVISASSAEEAFSKIDKSYLKRDCENSERNYIYVYALDEADDDEYEIILDNNLNKLF